MKLLAFIVSIVTLVLSACSPFTITNAEGEAPTPVVEVELAPTEHTGYQLVQVNEGDVNVEIGVGSPIPVHVDIGAQLPDVCGQVEYVTQKQDGTKFIIELFTIPSTEASCLRDTVPFRMKLPLNVTGLPAGRYSVEVNGVSADFTLDSGDAAASLPEVGASITKDDIQVDDVSIRVGVGSPIPGHALVSANLPKACAQLGEIRMHRDGNTFFVQLIADVPARTDCMEDSLPVRLEIPLNTINLPDGTYEVNVNGTVGTFEIPMQ